MQTEDSWLSIVPPFLHSTRPTQSVQLSWRVSRLISTYRASRRTRKPSAYSSYRRRSLWPSSRSPKQIAQGILRSEHLRPIHNVVRTITKTLVEKLRRRMVQYHRYALRARAEKLWMRQQLLTVMRQSETVQRRWRDRVNQLQGEMEEMRGELARRRALDR
ncbi:hypothetical protein BDV59DRAFT_39982 [Aspergillus ambiguus]|uniref:uncharacterized protein n=1 Tax=Aspergillus ambiguus TaxID=176160 RepID=UPI003CCCCB03